MLVNRCTFVFFEKKLLQNSILKVILLILSRNCIHHWLSRPSIIISQCRLCKQDVERQKPFQIKIFFLWLSF